MVYLCSASELWQKCSVQSTHSLFKLVDKLWLKIFDSSPVQVSNVLGFASFMARLEFNVV